MFFGVPVHGSFATLLTLTLPFVLTMLGVGLLISTRASTRDAAMQMAMGTILPSVFLSIWNIQAFPFGGTSILITVGVALETMKQVESQLLMRHYEGFLNS